VDDDTRLVQNSIAKPKSVGESYTLELCRSARRRFGAGRAERLELARRDHLGQHHRGRLERLDLFLGIGAVRAVLHDEHAQHVAAAQDGHAEKAVIDLLARLRAVTRTRDATARRKCERLGRLGDQADKAFPRLHRRQVDGLTVETFCRVESRVRSARIT
jgi:hypothetical protein